MRALALVLVVAVPSMSFAQQRVSLDTPCREAPVSQRLLIDSAFDEPAPVATSHAWVWWTVGAGAVAVALAVLFGAAFIAAQPHQYMPLTQSQFGCGASGSMCDAWINKPAR